MASPLTRDAVLALAPDASSSKAALGLLGPSTWDALGANDAAVWGECKGSGTKPYQTQVDLAGPTFKCSCPSRKFPCKHGLALLLLRADKAAAFADSMPPAWVTEWLGARAERERKKEQKREEKAEVAASPEELQAAAEREARRADKRWERIEQGAVELERWLGDLLRRGLGTVSCERLADWHTMAARLVDAQAPGLAGRLTQAADLVGQGPQWPERLLHRLGLLVLAIRGIRQRSALPEGQLADLRSVVGWPLDKADVLSSAPALADTWHVLGLAVEERDDKLVERRVWLHGHASGRRALLLDHAFGGRGFEYAWPVGSAMQAALAFYPGAAALRALPAAAPVASTAALPTPDPSAEWQHVAQGFAACPWTPLQPLVLPQARVVARPGGTLEAVAADRALPLQIGSTDRWTLLAASGGQAVTLAGEWDGEALSPLTLWLAQARMPAWQRSVHA